MFQRKRKKYNNEKLSTFLEEIESDVEKDPEEIEEASFSKKHYESIATILNKFYGQSGPKNANTDMIESLAIEFCEMFSKDNPSFDKSRFLNKVGIEDIEEGNEEDDEEDIDSDEDDSEVEEERSKDKDEMDDGEEDDELEEDFARLAKALSALASAQNKTDRTNDKNLDSMTKDGSENSSKDKTKTSMVNEKEDESEDEDEEEMDEAEPILKGIDRFIQALGEDPISGLMDLLTLSQGLWEKLRSKMSGEEKKMIKRRLRKMQQEQMQRGEKRWNI